MLLISLRLQISPTETVNNEVHFYILEFTCRLYGYTDVSVNNLRYKIYRASGGVISGEKLPPCFDSLNQHIKRANYQAAVWRRSLKCNPTIPHPVWRGWSEVENGIDVAWNECSPASNEVLYLLLCGCSS